jgi:hypothetical protein
VPLRIESRGVLDTAAAEHELVANDSFSNVECFLAIERRTSDGVLRSANLADDLHEVNVWEVLGEVLGQGRPVVVPGAAAAQRLLGFVADDLLSHRSSQHATARRWRAKNLIGTARC